MAGVGTASSHFLHMGDIEIMIDSYSLKVHLRELLVILALIMPNYAIICNLKFVVECRLPEVIITPITEERQK